VEEGVPQGSPVSPIVIPIHTAGLIQWVEESVQAEALSIRDDLRRVATGKDINLVVENLEAFASESLVCDNRRDLQFDTAIVEAEDFTLRGGHKKHLRSKLTARIMVRNSFVRFNTEATRWLAVWVEAYVTLKEHQK